MARGLEQNTTCNANQLAHALRLASDTAYKLSIRCLLYTSDAADERSSVDLGGRRIIKKKQPINEHTMRDSHQQQKHPIRNII